uniref:SMP-LTD domain-containing protein n=2 Tax=Kalanchoe fedtschenkoi TaxID=63787 RepID=A0A7N0TFF1_KALFE
MSLPLVFGFLLGALAILAVEAVLILLLVGKLNRKNPSSEKALTTSPSSPGTDGITDLDVRQSLEYAFKKQGSVWILEPEKLPKMTTMDKVTKEQKKKKEVLEVYPVRKYAKIIDRVLCLSDDSSDSCTKILLKGCEIEAVSATSLSSKKWAKRYPIKIESKISTLYKGSKIVYIYLETCWEKESWCKALRVASCGDIEHLRSLVLLSTEFRSYLTSLNKGYPSLLKPSAGSYAELVEKDNRFDDSSSKVRIFLKKLAKKASRNNDSKISSNILSSREDRKFSQRAQSFQESISASSIAKETAASRTPNSLATEKIVQRSLSSHSGEKIHETTNSDAEADEKVSVDEGTLCWNLLVSRLFFDARRNDKLCTLIQARIQRTLSSLRTPSYIGEVSCTGVKPGDLPPCILAMRALPTDLNEICALEIDVMYCGGFVLDIETRLEVRELEDQKESNSVGDISSDLLDECLGEQLNLSGGIPDATEEKDEKDSKTDGSKNLKCSTVPKWKSIINTVAKQVSQVPISLAIRIASLHGTLRLHIKPPPSDQLWFGFTSMPDIEFDLASSVGDHKITSGHLAVFLINRFKAVVRETLVLPNCESVCIPWMSAEKDDWVPRDIAPFIWLNQDTNAASSTHDVRSSQSEDLKIKHENIKERIGKLEEDIPKKLKQDEFGQQPNCETSDALTVTRIVPKPPSGSYQSLNELKTPLLKKDDSFQNSQHNLQETTELASSSRSIDAMEERNLTVDEDDSKTKRWGRRAKMLDLKKKMGEKLEEKRRTIEEKSRSIVEKMRAQGNS